MATPTFSKVYDALLGTLPTSQGWTKTGAFSTEAVASNLLHIVSAGSAYYSRTDLGALASNTVSLVHFRGKMGAGHTYGADIYLLMQSATAVYQTVDLTINGDWASWSYKKQAFFDTLQNVLGYRGMNAMNTLFDLMILGTYATGENAKKAFEIWYRVAGSYGRDDLTGYTFLGYAEAAAGGPSGSNFLKWGDIYYTLGLDLYVECVRYGEQASTFTMPSGTVALTVSSATVNPSGTSALSGTITGGLTGSPAVTLAGSDYTGASTTIVTGNTVTSAISLSGTTVSPGNTVTATQTPQTGVTVTISGNTINGTPTTIVTGVAGSTPTAPTIGPYPRWVSGELRFYKPTAGTFTLTGGTYTVLSATSANGAYSSALATPWASITWHATDGTGEYVTATTLGLTVSGTAWYRDRITDSNNLVAEGQTATYGGDTASSMCIVSIDLGPDYASRTVTATLSSLCTVRGQDFTRGAYTVTLDASGIGVMTLPRTEAATITDGGTGRPFMTFAYGNNSGRIVSYRKVPDASSASYASLEVLG